MNGNLSIVGGTKLFSPFRRLRVVRSYYLFVELEADRSKESEMAQHLCKTGSEQTK